MTVPVLYGKVTCADGWQMSLDANRLAYCRPRTDEGPYTHVEVYLPDAPQAWNVYRDGPGPIYGYVPVHLVRAFIAAHGGMRTGTLPPMVED